MRYYISDLHFFHEHLNVRMDQRGFDSVDSMNAYMIAQWNSRVRENDEVVILGDFSIGRGRETNEILHALRGRKYLITGNHDNYLEDRAFDTSLFQWIRPYAELKDNKRKIILSHYPIFCYDGQYRVDSEGNPRSYMLYGHVHKSFDEILVNDFILRTRMQRREVYGVDGLAEIPCHMINCFCMFSDYKPLTLEEWIEVDRKRREALNALTTNMREDGTFV